MNRNGVRDRQRGKTGKSVAQNRHRLKTRPMVVPLEDRWLLSTFVVNNPTDSPVSGETDLRQAIAEINQLIEIGGKRHDRQLAARALVGWMGREQAIKFLTEDCVFASPLTSEAAEAIWKSHKAVVDNLPREEPIAAQKISKPNATALIMWTSRVVSAPPKW